MPPAKAIKTILLPKTDRFRAQLPRGCTFLGVSVISNPEAQKNTLYSADSWDSPEWPVLNYMHDLHEKETNYHSFLICPAGSITEPLPLQGIGSFTLYGYLVFHVFEVPDNQRPPDPMTTTSLAGMEVPTRSIQDA